MDWKRVDKILGMLPVHLKPAARAIILEAERLRRVPKLAEMAEISGLNEKQCETIYQKFQLTHTNSKAERLRISKEQRDKVAWRKNLYAEDIKKIAAWFHSLDHIYEASTNTYENGCQALDYILRIDMKKTRDPVARLLKLLQFAVQDVGDGFCWKPQIRSLHGLRNKSKNGMYKWENVENSMMQVKWEQNGKAKMDPGIARYLADKQIVNKEMG
jgi:hypothetical protein